MSRCAGELLRTGALARLRARLFRETSALSSPPTERLRQLLVPMSSASTSRSSRPAAGRRRDTPERSRRRRWRSRAMCCRWRPALISITRSAALTLLRYRRICRQLDAARRATGGRRRHVAAVLAEFPEFGCCSRSRLPPESLPRCRSPPRPRRRPGARVEARREFDRVPRRQISRLVSMSAMRRASRPTPCARSWRAAARARGCRGDRARCSDPGPQPVARRAAQPHSMHKLGRALAT